MADAAATDVDGPRAFTARRWAVQWPLNFKINGVQPCDRHANPKYWLTSYATAIRVGGGNTNIMANYLPVMFQPATMNWLTSL
jgi:hypothetical protein